MAKFTEVFEDTQKKFNEVIDGIDSLREVSIKILANDRLKEIGKVVKTNDLINYMTNEDVIILLNEKIFEQLEESQQKIIVDELIAKVYFDAEKTKLTIVQPDIVGHSGVIRKYGLEEYYRTKTLIKELFSAEAQDEAENETK